MCICFLLSSWATKNYLVCVEYIVRVTKLEVDENMLFPWMEFVEEQIEIGILNSMVSHWLLWFSCSSTGNFVKLVLTPIVVGSFVAYECCHSV